MLFIRCPWCGCRDETEFRYGGQAHVDYPRNPHDLDDRAWAEYLFFRDNPGGRFIERWSHSAGCRRWFTIERDTVTNEMATNEMATNEMATNETGRAEETGFYGKRGTYGKSVAA